MYDGGIDPPDDLRFSIGSGFGLSIDPNSPTTAGIINSSAASPTAPEGISGYAIFLRLGEHVGKKPPPMRFGGAGEAMSSPPRTLPGGNTPRKASIDAGAAPDRAASVIADTHRLCRGGEDGERRRRRRVPPHSRGSKTLTKVRELLDAKTAVVEEDNAEAAKEGAAKAAVAKVQKDAAKAARDAQASNRAALKDKDVAGTRASGSRLAREDHELFEARHSDLDTTTKINVATSRSAGTLRSKASSRTARGRHVGDQRPSEMEGRGISC
eukprot:g14924.t1